MAVGSSTTRIETAPNGSPKPSLVLLVESGAICSRLEDGKLVFDPNQVDKMRNGIPAKIADLFKSIKTKKTRDGRINGTKEEGYAQKLERFARVIQEIYRSTHQSVIALVGRDKMAPRYAMAAALALSKEDLASHELNRSFVIASSVHAAGEDGSDAQRVLNQAALLVSQPSMRGKLGFLDGKNVHPLPGLEARHDTNPTEFVHKINPIATLEDTGHYLYADDHPAHFPLGDPSDDFSLRPGVRTLVLPEDPAERMSARLVDFADSTINSNDPLSGIVLKTSGYHPVERFTETLQLAVLESLGKPILFVGGPRNQWPQTQDESLSQKMLDEHRLFVDGNGFPSGQAKVILSEALAAADRSGLGEDPLERIEFIRARISALNFRASLEDKGNQTT